MPYKNKEDKYRYYRNIDSLRRKALITLLGGKCSRCDNSDEDVLQFDHIKPIRLKANLRKRFRSLYPSLISGKESISNLQLLCANCHVKKTRAEGVI